MPYIGRSTDGFGVRNRFLYLASADDTSVSGADVNGATLTFTDGAYVDVYLNGVLLKAGTDYNTNTANTIASLAAMAANDEVTVVVYDVFTVGDMVSATSGGTFVGNVAMSGTLGVTGATTTAAITASGVIKTDDATEATSTTDGSLQTDGGLSVVKDAVFGDDIKLLSDASVIHFGANSEVTLTHVHDTGLRMEDTDKFQLGAGGDLSLSHNGTNSLIANSTGALLISGDDIAMNSSGGESMFSALSNGTVRLYYDNALKLTTTANGIGVEAGATYSHDTNFKGMDVGDQAFYGEYDGGSLYILKNRYYDGSNWIAKENGGGSTINMDTSGDIHFQTSANVNAGQTAVLQTRATVKESNGLMYIAGAYSTTTGTGANMYIQSDGAFYRSTSSRRYKNTIKDATHGLAELLKLRSVTYKGNNDGDIILGGLIAEEVHDTGLTEFVQYNDDDEPDALSYGNMVSLCIKAIQEQQSKIETLEAKVKNIKGSVDE
jgi:hypothetical protein